MAAELARSYGVIMTDARGHGHSGTSAAEVSIALLAEDAVAVIRALELQKPFLVGHSMGAVMAATVAANYPDVVRAIVLEDPPLLDKPPSQTDINKSLGVTNEEQSAPPGWQWLFELRALPRQERIARGTRSIRPGPKRRSSPGRTPKPRWISLFWSLHMPP
jgi:pimeloyl-ACP methyl ester carboxylesterase